MSVNVGATISNPVALTPSTQSLTLIAGTHAVTATVNTPTDVTPPTVPILVLTNYNVQVNNNVIVGSTLEALTLSSYNNPITYTPVQGDITVDVESGTLTLTAQNVTSIEGTVDVPPVINSTPSPSFVNGTGSTYSLANFVTDDGATALTYVINGTLPGTVTLAASTGILTYTETGGDDTTVANATFTVSDAGNQATSSSFNITISDLVLTQLRETPEQIALEIDASSYSSNAYATLEYKLTSSGTWIDAHPLYRQTTDDKFMGIIFDLAEGETYDVRATVNGSTVYQSQHTTRALPAAAGTATTYTSFSTFKTACESASAGDVIELQDGSHTLTSIITITASGTAANPIYIRGQSQSGTILNCGTTRAFYVHGDHIIIENMTITGSYAADYNTSLQPAIRLGNDSANLTIEYCTIRDCTISGFPDAVLTSGGSDGTYADNCLIYNNTLTGTLSWSSLVLQGDYAWNNDGIRAVGAGNCIWNNTMEGYGDSITYAHSPLVTESQPIECNYAYRNFIRNSGNDAFELDHCHRFIGIYDNYLENVDTGVSQSDENMDGPVYVFRNIFANIAIKWFKSNAQWKGWHWYNNTFAETAKDPAESSDTANNGFYNDDPTWQTRWAYRNNIHVCTDSGITFLWRQVWSNPPFETEFDISHNSWYPTDKNITWANNGPGTYSSVAIAQAATDTHDTLYPSGAGLSPTSYYHDQDVGTDSNPFTNSLGLGANTLTELSAMTTLELDSGSTAKNAGVAIPGITDDFTGIAPDMGAVIEGRDAVAYGAGISAPSWVTGLTVDTWTSQGTNVFSDVYASNSGQYANTGPRSVLHTWNGGQLATNYGTKGGVLHYGGGHSDYYGNEVYVFDLASRTWSKLTDPSSHCADMPSGAAAGDGIYADGTPGAPHTYHRNAYRPSTNEYLITRREVNNLGDGGVDAITRFNADNLTWICSAATSTGGSFAAGASSCYDANRDTVWLIDARSGLNWSSYDFDTNAWTNYSPSLAGTPRVDCCTHVPTKDCVVFMTGESQLVILDPASPSSAAVVMTTSGSAPTFGRYDPFVWSSNLGALVYNPSKSSSIYLLTPPAGAFTGTWVWTQVSVTGSADIDTQDVGTYSKFQVVDYNDATIATYISNESGDYNVIRLA